MTAFVFGAAASAGFLLGGYLNSQSAARNTTLARALENTEQRSLAEVDAQLSATAQGRSQFDRPFVYSLMAGHTWCPSETETETMNGKAAVVRRVNMYDDFDVYQWKEIEAQREVYDGCGTKVSKETTGRWITTKEYKNHRTNLYGDSLQIQDGSYSTLTVPQQHLMPNLWVKTGDELKQNTSDHQQQANGSVNVVVNNGGDSKGPTYLGTRCKEKAILKGKRVVVMGHVYHSDEGKLVLTDKSVSNPQQPFLIRYGDLVDIRESALSEAQSYDKISNILYAIGASGLLLSGIGAGYKHYLDKRADRS